TAGELRAGEELLGDDGLAVRLEEKARLRIELVTGSNEILLGDSLARSFLNRLEEERKTLVARDQLFQRGLGIDQCECGVRNSAGRQNILGSRFVEAEGEREWIAAGVRDIEKLTDRGDVRLAVRSAESLGDVEDDVGALG